MRMSYTTRTFMLLNGDLDRDDDLIMRVRLANNDVQQPPDAPVAAQPLKHADYVGEVRVLDATLATIVAVSQLIGYG